MNGSKNSRACEGIKREYWKFFRDIRTNIECWLTEDLERVTKRTFLQWIARPNKDLSEIELLRDKTM